MNLDFSKLSRKEIEKLEYCNWQLIGALKFAISRLEACKPTEIHFDSLESLAAAQSKYNDRLENLLEYKAALRLKSDEFNKILSPNQNGYETV